MKTPSHWFRDRWLYDLVVIERRGMAEVAAKFGMTASGVCQALAPLCIGGVSAERRRVLGGRPID